MLWRADVAGGLNPKENADRGCASAVRALVDFVLIYMQDAARSVVLTAPASGNAIRVEPQAAPSGSLTEDELSALKELQQLLEDEIRTDKWSVAARAEAQFHMDDFTMMRFVKSRPDSSAAALDMYRTAMHWRAKHDINELFRELHPLAPEPWSSRQRTRAAHYFGGFGGFDLQGIPYFVLRLGQADVGGMARSPEALALLMQADAVNMETIFRTVRVCSAATGRLVRVRILCDLQGLGLGALRHAAIIKSVMQVGPNIFPEGASKVCAALLLLLLPLRNVSLHPRASSLARAPSQ